MEYRKSELNPAVKRAIARKELYLDRKCRKIWSQENRLGETFLFGSFCKNRDRLIVTIAYGDKAVHGGFYPVN
mgnify:CR=1 FL=1